MSRLKTGDIGLCIVKWSGDFNMLRLEGIVFSGLRHCPFLAVSYSKLQRLTLDGSTWETA